MLSHVQQLNLAARFHRRKMVKGDVLIRQDDKASDFFIILSGSCDVLIDGKLVGELSKNDYCGEQAFLNETCQQFSVAFFISKTCVYIFFGS